VRVVHRFSRIRFSLERLKPSKVRELQAKIVACGNVLEGHLWNPTLHQKAMVILSTMGAVAILTKLSGDAN
jgi:hypothetical protein